MSNSVCAQREWSESKHRLNIHFVLAPVGCWGHISVGLCPGNLAQWKNTPDGTSGAQNDVHGAVRVGNLGPDLVLGVRKTL